MRGSPAQGWAFLLPFPLYAFGTEALAFTALFLAGVWAVLGYWGGRTVSHSQPAFAIATIAGGVILGLALIPALFNLPIAHWSEWLGAIAGAATGAGIGRVLDRDRQEPAG